MVLYLWCYMFNTKTSAVVGVARSYDTLSLIEWDKNCLQSTMDEPRFSAFTLMHIYKDFQIYINRAIYSFEGTAKQAYSTFVSINKVMNYINISRSKNAVSDQGSNLGPPSL